MKKYHVKYFYLATGMEGQADRRDYGTVEAENPEAAKDLIMLEKFPEDRSPSFTRSCLEVREVI